MGSKTISMHAFLRNKGFADYSFFNLFELEAKVRIFFITL